MTPEEAKALTEQLQAQIDEKVIVFNRLAKERDKCEARIKAIRAEHDTMRNEARWIKAQIDILKRIEDGMCRENMRQNSQGKWECFKSCNNKAKPGEELCGVHLRWKKSDAKHA